MIVAGIAAFNEGESIGITTLQASKYVDSVLVVDDGSHDLTCEIAKRAGATVIRHQNVGYAKSILTLLKKAIEYKADVLVILTPGISCPDDIPFLVAPILKGEANLVFVKKLSIGIYLVGELFSLEGSQENLEGS